MFKTLLKKQIYEVFKSWFYNARTNKKRSTLSTVLLIALFAVLFVGLIGGSITMVLITVCPVLVYADCGWLYYAYAGAAAVMFGAFGSIFSTYSGLYLSKDNDMLFSMPIPTRLIISSRLVSVYLMGLMYSAVISVPTAVVYLFFAPVTVLSLLGGIAFVLFTSLLVFVLSCSLGYIVARISVKLKNKSFVSVIIALVVIILYYFVYFKAAEWIESGLEKVMTIGASIKDEAYLMYLLGCFAEGEPLGLFCSAIVHFGLTYLTLFIISRSFMKIAIRSNTVSAVKGKRGKVKQSSPFIALVKKEAARFTSNATFMLNASFSEIMLLLLSVAVFFIKGPLIEILNEFTGGAGESWAFGAMLAINCMLCSVSLEVVPSVSLEGKTIWQVKCLPIDTSLILKAKMAFQILLASPFTLLLSVCSSIALAQNAWQVVAMLLLPQVVVILTTEIGLILAVRTANLNWTNEIVPIKQDINILFAMLFDFLTAVLIFAPYFLVMELISIEVYSLFATVVFAIICVLVYELTENGLKKCFERL